MDYSIFYSETFDYQSFSAECESFDVFVSAYNDSERVLSVFNGVKSKNKIWIIHPEYGYNLNDSGFKLFDIKDDCVCPLDKDEIVQVVSIFQKIDKCGIDVSDKNVRICFDITGFMRNVIVYLIVYLKSRKILNKVWFLYSEPSSYKEQKDTVFTSSINESPRSVSGIKYRSKSGARNYAVVSVGFDDRIISQVFNNRESYNFYPVYAFPSLGADMYQQSVIRVSKCGVANNDSWLNNKKFAPANDPFLMAQKVSDIVREIEKKEEGGVFNLHLCPFSTKAQALGMSIYWLYEGKNNINFLMPDWNFYASETGVGVKKISLYEVELDW